MQPMRRSPVASICYQAGDTRRASRTSHQGALKHNAEPRAMRNGRKQIAQVGDAGQAVKLPCTHMLHLNMRCMMC